MIEAPSSKSVKLVLGITSSIFVVTSVAFGSPRKFVLKLLVKWKITSTHFCMKESDSTSKKYSLPLKSTVHGQKLNYWICLSSFQINCFIRFSASRYDQTSTNFGAKMARRGTTRQSTFDLLAKAVRLLVCCPKSFTPKSLSMYNIAIHNRKSLLILSTEILVQTVWGCPLIGLITGRSMRGEGSFKVS